MNAAVLFASCVSADERLAKVRSFDIDRLWEVLHAEHVQETVLRAARSRLNRLIKEARHLVMTFEDHGQDFLTWTLDKNGKVIDCNAQCWCWVGGHVTDHRSLIPGVHPLYQSKGDGAVRPVNYPLEKVQHFKGGKA